jgi:hypothetical protein
MADAEIAEADEIHYPKRQSISSRRGNTSLSKESLA